MSISHDFLCNSLVKEELVTTNIDCAKLVLDSLGSTSSSRDNSCITLPRKCLEVHQDGIFNFLCGGVPPGL